MRPRRGHTLMELLVVLSIIVILILLVTFAVVKMFAMANALKGQVEKRTMASPHSTVLT